MTKAEEKSVKTAKKPEKAHVYDKQQILKVEIFARDIDLLEALLDEKKQYTMNEVQKIIDAYKKKGVR